ncbi:MAG TPA: hypothetical protein VFF69_01575, partial [Phycisphaerales bacterium]|nr:hypothetical protein [Phycisphaerales bacterium]
MDAMRLSIGVFGGLAALIGGWLPAARGQCLDPQAVPGIVGTSGQVILIETPINLLDGATTCDGAAYVMLESVDLAPGTITGDIVDAGLYNADNQPTPTGLPTEGLIVDTYLLHFDTGGDQSIVEGSFTLDQDVIGIITNGNSLIATDDLLGNPGTFYEGDPRRDVEWDETPQGDPISYVALSGDRRTVAFRLRVDGSFQDQMRVIAAPHFPACDRVFGPGGSYSIGADDMSYEECRIVVDNCTLTIDGTHLFHSIVVRNNGVITHSAGYTDGEFRGMELVVLESVTVDLGSRIDAGGRGYPGDEGPGKGLAGSNYGGGGGYGGEGGRAANGELSDGGGSYGSITEPIDFGSGGGQDVDNLQAGRRGGGAIRLDVGGTLTVNGYIAASGETWQSNAASPGAGAGGSIWITAASVAGTTGKIQ